MRPETDQTAFDWICSDRAEKQSGPAPKAVFVSNLIPPIFKTYVEVLHWTDACYSDIDNPLSPSENSILKITPCEPLRSFIQHRRAQSLPNRIRWSELAELLGVPFVPGICSEWFRNKLSDPWCLSRFLCGSIEGRKEECAALVSSLKQADGNDEVFFRFSDIQFYVPALQNQPQLFAGHLDEVCGFQQSRHLEFEYWWPADRCWCVCSNDDLLVTLVAGD